jgi:hypothetical protein
MRTELAEKILLLQLEWIRAADGKVSPLFAINLAMLGLIVALMKERNIWTLATIIFTASCLMLLTLSIVFLVFAMFPRLSGPKGSNIFFGGTTKKTANAFLKEVKSLTDEEIEEDLLRQAYRNAQIAKAKYFNIRLAFVFSFISVPFWLITIYLLYVC